MGPEAMEAITADDCCLIAGPIFHCGSTLYVYAMLAKGGTIAMIPEFRTADFWPAVRDTGSTVVLLLGVMARSEERRVGKGCVGTCRSWWWPYHSKTIMITRE